MTPKGPNELPASKADGAAGERYAAAILTCALCAQASNTTLQEDGKKLDLKIALLNAFSIHKSIVSVHGQIKHGASFAQYKSGKFTLQNLGEDTVATLQDGSQPALLIWVPPWPLKKIYWHIVRPKGKHRNPIRIAEGDYVTPGLRFELSRFAHFERRNPRYPCLKIPPLGGDSTSGVEAKKTYADLKKETLINPLLGRIDITRLAWRHVTRFSRAVAKRQRSFHALKYLHAFLKKVPTRYLVDRKPADRTGDKTMERNEVVFWYRHAFQIDGIVQTLLVRFIEEIAYPTNWAERPLSEGDVAHRVTLKSWWYKPEKESGASLVHTDADASGRSPRRVPASNSTKGRESIEAPKRTNRMDDISSRSL